MPTVSKWHGAGNDFVVLSGDINVPDEERFVRSICDRGSGLDHPGARRRGADGVLFLSPEPGHPPRVGMHHVQPDGSTPDACGNGIRCAAKWAAESFDADRVIVEAADDPHGAHVDGWNVTVEMGTPSFDPQAVPLARETPLVQETVAGLTVTAVTTGVPHAVAFVDDVSEVDLSAVAPPVRHAEVFPDGANVTVASQVGTQQFAQRTYERGVEAETDACGTGAVAIGAVSVETGRAKAGTTLVVSPPGGRLTVTFDEGRTALAGPVERTFEAEVSVADDGTVETTSGSTQ